MKRYPLVLFFCLTFGLTWLAWLPYILSENGTGVLPFRFPAVFGSAQTLGILPGAYLGPLTSAFLVTSLVDGRPGLRRWSARLVRWRVPARWYPVVLLAVPVVGVAATLPLSTSVSVPPAGVLLAVPVMLVLQFLTTGVAEEPGWRDFAQPRLQDRFGPLTGSLVLGPLWGAWHLPLFFTEWAGWPDVDWLMAAEFVGSAVLLSIVMTWLFNSTGESLPVVMLFHANVNTLFSLLWPEMFPHLDPARDSLHVLLLGSGVCAVALIAATRGRLGLRPAGAGARPSSEPSRPR